jgi:phosphatidylinositol alpha-1,6-mannosyltransferase
MPEHDSMKVLWITPSFFPRVGGLEVYVENLVGSLATLCNVGLVTRRGQWFPRDEPLSHFTVSEVQPRGFSARWQTANELNRIATQFEPDIVHLGGAEAAAQRLALPEAMPVVATIHANDLTLARANQSDPLHVHHMVKGLNACAEIFAVSEHTAALCRKWGITAPIRVVTAGCDTEFFCPRPALGAQARQDFRLPKDVPILLTVSRLVPRKGHLNVVDAIRRLPFRVHWVVVGDGPCQETLAQAAVEFGIADQVSMWGVVSDDDLPGLYNACDIFVFTPEERHMSDGRIDSEGFGLVFLEASACAKPVIGSQVSGCKDAVIHGATGILVPPSDPVRLAQSIEFLLRDTYIAKNLGQGGCFWVKASGGWTRLARQTLECYQELLHKETVPCEPPDIRIPA